MAKKRQGGPTDPHPNPDPARSPRPRDAPSTPTAWAPCRCSNRSSSGSGSRSSSAIACPREDPRTKIATATGLLLLIKNLLVSREPLYGVGEWAARFVPEWLGLSADELVHLNDDRVGRCLDRLFDSDIASLTLSVVAHAVREFAVELDELHNDSTTVTFHGAYDEAAEETTRRGKPTARDHLGTQQGPSARPQATALHPHRRPRRRRAGPVPGPERQRRRRHDPPRHLGPALQADRPARLPLRGRLQAGHRREHGLSPSAWGPVPQRPAPHPERGRRLPRVAAAGPGHEAADLRQDRRGRASSSIGTACASRRR